MEATYKKLKKMSKQRMFDKAVKAVIKQGQKSVAEDCNGNRMCAYRGEGGLMCAVGHMIEDRDYTPLIEGDNVYGVLGGLTKLKKDILRDVQIAHDRPHGGDNFLSDFKMACIQVAARYDLDASFLQEYK